MRKEGIIRNKCNFFLFKNKSVIKLFYVFLYVKCICYFFSNKKDGICTHLIYIIKKTNSITLVFFFDIFV